MDLLVSKMLDLLYLKLDLLFFKKGLKTFGCKHGKVDNSWSLPSVKWKRFNFMY